MPSYNPPIKNADYITYVSLRSFATPGSLQANPTLAAGDVKLYFDGVASTLGAAGSANAITLPVVVGATVVVKVALDDTEMNFDNVTVVFIDQTSPKEWEDYSFNIPTAASSSAPSAADIADAVWDEALSGHTTGGSAGKAVSDIDTHTDTETGASAIRTALGLATANLDTQLDALPTAAENATAVKASLLATVVSGVAQGAGLGSDTLQLASGGVTSDDQYNGYIVAIVAGAGKGQQRQILDSINTGDYIQVVGGDWETAVDNTSVYVLFAN